MAKAATIDDGDDAARRVSHRFAQTARFPADDALLVAMLEFVDVSAVGLATQINRKWRRVAGGCALWQSFVQRRWPDVWSGLAAPKSLDARALYRRLAFPHPWRETASEGVLVLFELVSHGKTVFSATANLYELQTQSLEAGLGDFELRLRPTDDAAKLAAQIPGGRLGSFVRDAMQEYEAHRRQLAVAMTKAEIDAAGTSSFGRGGHQRAALSLIRRADGAVLRSELNIMQTSDVRGIEFSGILSPTHPLRSFARRRALRFQEANERARQGNPDSRRHAGGNDYAEQKHELVVQAVLSFDGKLGSFCRPEFPLAREHREAFLPGDIAIAFQAAVWGSFHRTNEIGDYPLSDDDEDNGLIEWDGGSGPDSIKLDKHLLGGLGWS